MFVYASFLALALIRPAKADTIRIGIIDTGYSPSFAKKIHAIPLKICSTGSYDFDTNTQGVGSVEYGYNHGTYIASLISDILQNVDYCAVIYQVYSDKLIIKSNQVDNITKAVAMSRSQNLIAINMSYSGKYYNEPERQAMIHASNLGIHMFIAAGNDKLDLDIDCTAYPACYKIKNTTIVEALSFGGKRCSVSNFGVFTEKQSGMTLPQWGISSCATSYAAPRALAYYVLQALKSMPTTTKTH